MGLWLTSPWLRKAGVLAGEGGVVTRSAGSFCPLVIHVLQSFLEKKLFLFILFFGYDTQHIWCGSFSFKARACPQATAVKVQNLNH